MYRHKNEWVENRLRQREIQHFRIEKRVKSRKETEKVKIDVGGNLVECKIIEIMYKIIPER